MIKRVVRRMSRSPACFNFLRRLIEFDFITLKAVIRKEFGKDTLKAGKVLDVPCGTGEFCRLFTKENYLGIDISDEYIGYAGKKYRHSFLLRDALDSGLADGQFERVLMIGFLHHLDDGSVRKALKETRRVLKTGGKMLLLEDSPVRGWNIVGKILQKLDVGANIRPAGLYKEMLSDHFNIEKNYPVRNGFWDYSVFVLVPK